MKPTQKLHQFLLAAGSALLAISFVHAADVTWDITPGTVGAGDSAITGGAGTWNDSNGNWTTDAGVNNIAWSGTTETAVFGGTAGAVDLLSNVSVGGLKFNTTGYSITNSANNTITFGADGAIFTDTGVTATIGQKVLSGSATVEKTGAGILRVGTNLSSDTTTNFTGALKISAGTVRLSPYFNATKSVGSFILNGGALHGWAGWGISQTTTNVSVTANSTISAGESGSASGQNRSLALGALSIGANTLTLTKHSGNSSTTVSFTSTTLTGNAVFDVLAGSFSVPTQFTPGAVGDGGLGRSLTKNGVGIMNLTSANTYSGGTILNQGTIALGTSGTLGATTGSLQVNNSNSTAAGTNVILNLATGANTTVGSLSGTIATPTSGTNTATINTQTGRTFIVNQTTDGTYAGVIAGSGSFTLGGLSNSKLTLSGANTYLGGTTVSAGTLEIGGSGTLGSGNYAATISNAGTLRFNSSAAQTLGGEISGAGSLEKDNSGTLTLTAANTYTGNTTITGGTLALSGAGSIASSPLIQINSSATLDVSGMTGNFTLGTSQTVGGSGTFIATGKTVVASGTLSPGSSPGTLIQDGGTLQLDGVNGNLNWQVYDADGAAGTGYDTVNLINGATLDLSTLSALDPYDINLWSLSAIGPDVNGNATNFNNTLNYSWTLFSTGSVITGFDASFFDISIAAANGTTGFTNDLGGGSFTVGLADGDTDLVLLFNAASGPVDVIPEPGAVLLSGLGSLLLLRRRRN